MSLHIGMDKHGVRWKDGANCWLFGQTKSDFRALQVKKEGCFQEGSGFRFLMGTMRKSFCLLYILRKKVVSCNKKKNYDLK